PANYEFSFYIKAVSPENNFEFKLIDSTGTNVWWRNTRNYKFPTEWTKVKIKQRQIIFAWGTSQDGLPSKIDRIEFTIASVNGGKGTIYLDDFRFPDFCQVE
ncbi:MAG: hypothetical protein Q8S01_08755, partial [Ignavibacteria bacterium]|nr:hypothetical protein [Ignavibacteria bacterium]